MVVSRVELSEVLAVLLAFSSSFLLIVRLRRGLLTLLLLLLLLPLEETGSARDRLKPDISQVTLPGPASPLTMGRGRMSGVTPLHQQETES